MRLEHMAGRANRGLEKCSLILMAAVESVCQSLGFTYNSSSDLTTSLLDRHCYPPFTDKRTEAQRSNLLEVTRLADNGVGIEPLGSPVLSRRWNLFASCQYLNFLPQSTHAVPSHPSISLTPGLLLPPARSASTAQPTRTRLRATSRPRLLLPKSFAFPGIKSL